MYVDISVVFASLAFVCCYFFMRKRQCESVSLSLMTSFITAIACCVMLCLIYMVGYAVIAFFRECIKQHKSTVIIASVACIVVVTDAIVHTVKTAYRRKQNRIRRKLTKLLD